MAKRIIKQLEDLYKIEVDASANINIAYDRGYEQGFRDGKLSVSKASDQYVAEQCDKAMQMGMEITWDCIETIINLWKDNTEGIKDFIELFNSPVITDVFKFSPQEAIAKIKKYEEKQNPIVKVGDELECAGKHLVVTWINDENRWNGMLLYGGDTGEERGQVISCMKGFETWKPTGKHISLVELKGESN